MKKPLPWSQDLVDRVVSIVLEDGKPGLSVFSVSCPDPFDSGHALGVLSETIPSTDFDRQRGTKRKSGCTRGTLIIPRKALPRDVRFTFAPLGNLDFHPASDRHFDLHVEEPEAFARVILDGIRSRTMICCVFGNEDATYRTQAGVAYSQCLRSFGLLDETAPPYTWKDGARLPASVQIETLTHLAGRRVVVIN